MTREQAILKGFYRATEIRDAADARVYRDKHLLRRLATTGQAEEMRAARERLWERYRGSLGA